MTIFYVSAHSKIPKKTKSAFMEINSVPQNTYIIMKSQCGEYSWLDDTAFIEKYLTTPEGVRYLEDFVTKTSQSEIDGKRIYRPGDIGPINQVLNFKQKENKFFLGVDIAPLNSEKIKNNSKQKVFKLDRNFLENFYKNFYTIFKSDDDDDDDTGFEENPGIFMNKEQLIFNIMDMMSLYANSIELMTFYQFEKLLTDEKYFRNFINKKVKINSFTENIKISQLLEKKGPAIYVIDTCRAYRKVTYVGDMIHVAASRKKGFGALSVRRDGVKKALSKMKPDNRKKYEERITNALQTIPKLTIKERTVSETI